jgi:hypothetical protein
MAGCIPLLLLAGTIEGFLSPSGLPEYVRMLIGLGILIIFYAWLLLVGHEEQPVDADAAPAQAPAQQRTRREPIFRRARQQAG